jgi:penicillin-binding protein 1B
VPNAAVQLLNFALNATTRTGTARSVSSGGQIKIDVAGKTGTSNDSRDSWYAGFTGEHLGVVWLGRDDNQGTGLTGASGALKVWTALFSGLPSAPLHFTQTAGMSFQPFDTGAGCEEWRFLPVLPPYRTRNSVNCMGALTGSP